MTPTTIAAIEYKKNRTEHNFKILQEKIHKFIERISIYYSCKNSYFNQKDLIQSGYVGVLKALEKYDINLNLEFTTYAVWHIRAQMGYLVFESLPVKYSHIKYDRVDKRKERNADLANLKNTTKLDSLEYDIIKHDPTEEIENKVTVSMMLAKLEDKTHKNIIKKYYGINTEKIPIASIAKNSKKSRERIRQIKEDGITRLRQLHDKPVTNTVKNSGRLYS